MNGFAALYFKTASNGQKLFFPWSHWGRGYVLASDHDYERLRRQVARFQQLGVLMGGALSPLSWIAMVCVLALVLVSYLVWTRHAAGGLEPANERLSLREAYGSAAVSLGAFTLWMLEILSLFCPSICILVVVRKHSSFGVEDWSIVLPGTGLAAGGAAIFAYMLGLRRNVVSPVS
jgi:hypothetical protein